MDSTERNTRAPLPRPLGDAARDVLALVFELSAIGDQVGDAIEARDQSKATGDARKWRQAHRTIAALEARANRIRRSLGLLP